ncbi:MAG: hypothetical protein GF355_13205 [Candidatus Eisenbacteria bacterium]|nr:hypothetical protein [Candidatus Eisenbacteria bacterium]
MTEDRACRQLDAWETLVAALRDGLRTREDPRLAQTTTEDRILLRGGKAACW